MFPRPGQRTRTREPQVSYVDSRVVESELINTAKAGEERNARCHPLRCKQVSMNKMNHKEHIFWVWLLFGNEKTAKNQVILGVAAAEMAGNSRVIEVREEYPLVKHCLFWFFHPAAGGGGPFRSEERRVGNVCR